MYQSNIKLFILYLLNKNENKEKEIKDKTFTSGDV